MDDRFRVAMIEVWPNSGGQGGYISVYAASIKEYGDAVVSLSVDIELLRHACGYALANKGIDT